jgi:adenylate kinase
MDGRLVLLFGPPGSGKSTQGKLLTEEKGWNWISTGAILREYGDDAMRAKLNRGELATDDEMNPLADKVVAEKASGGQTLVIDGYPRNSIQARRMLAKWPKIAKAILIDVPESEIVERIEARNRDQGDNAKATTTRINIFEQNIKSIKNVLTGGGVEWVEIDGLGTVEDVNKKIIAALRDL